MSSQAVSMDTKEQVPAAAESAPGCNLDTAKQYWGAAQLAVNNFVINNPLIAIVTTVVFGIFGLTMILPTFISTIVVYVPLLAFCYLAVNTLIDEENRAAFSHNLAESIVPKGGNAAAQLNFVDGALSAAGQAAHALDSFSHVVDQSPEKPKALPPHKQRASDILPSLFGVGGHFSLHGSPAKATPANSPQ